MKDTVLDNFKEYVHRALLVDLDDGSSWGETDIVKASICLILLKKQSEEHKKQMREAIEDAVYGGEHFSIDDENFYKTDSICKYLFKKYNCECHHHVTSKSNGKCVKCGEQVLVK